MPGSVGLLILSKYFEFQGDSGGPLICRNEEEKFTICGVVSGGVGCEGEDQRPSIYTRTHYYREWIQRNTEIDGKCAVG